MKIAMVGFGKMGHMIKSAAEACGNEVVLTVDVVAADADVKVSAGDYEAVARAVKESGAQGIIEFTHPTAVMGNIKVLLPLGLPLVVGTTGWVDKEDEVKALAASCGGIIMRSSNFSIGVNLFYKVVAEAAKLFNEYNEYDAATWEMHHRQKADSPSGTALSIAQVVMENFKRKTETEVDAFHEKPAENALHVSSTRCGFVPGTHAVFFDGPADQIEIRHTARSREGFAYGAVHALEKLNEGILNGDLKKGNLYGMEIFG